MTFQNLIDGNKDNKGITYSVNKFTKKENGSFNLKQLDFTTNEIEWINPTLLATEIKSYEIITANIIEIILKDSE